MATIKQLKTQPIWLCWMGQERRGTTSKVPRAAGGGKTGTSEEYRRTWVTYDEARKATEKHGYDGVGFVIQEGMFFLDMDHVNLDSPRVREIIERFGSYAEKSQSGKGVHIYGLCDLSRIPTVERDGKLTLDSRYYSRNGKDMELYIGGLTNRYAVFTGDALNDASLRDCTDVILETLERDMKKAESNLSAANGLPNLCEQSQGRKLDAAMMIDALCRQKNAEKFRRLFYDGDMTDYPGEDGEEDHSRADLALCGMIAFRAGDNPELIDEVFRQSALYRDKWEREDYRGDTIRKAIEGQQGQFYTTPKERPPFVSVDKKENESVNKPMLAKYVRENLFYIMVRSSPDEEVTPYVYRDGYYQKYAPDMLKGVIKGFVEDYDERLVSMPVVEEVYRMLMSDIRYVRRDELNADESIINVKNGLLKVTAESVELFPHTPEVYSTIQIPVTWTDTKADTPVFDRYMRSLTRENDDVELLLREFIGVTLSNVRGYRFKKALFLVGPGNTGKSQFKALLERILGPENYASIDLATLEGRFGTSYAYEKRLIGSADLGFATIKELRTFKQLTGGDNVFAEYKGQKGFFFTYAGMICFGMNQLPRFGGDDGPWVYDRIVIVRCENVILPEHQDKNLLDKLFQERDGIFYAAVKALQRVMRNGYSFDEPDCVKAERAEYRRINNSALTFITECMAKPEGAEHENMCTSGVAYRLYCAWCKDYENGYAKTDGEFKAELAKYLGVDGDGLVEHRKNGNYYRGLTVKKDTFDRYYGDRW